MAANDVVLITGCSTGFGRVTAETLARNKYRVFTGMRETKGRNAASAAEIASLAKRESLPLRVACGPLGAVPRIATSEAPAAELLGYRQHIHYGK